VGTLPEYRNRGLVRLQFEVVHAWSAQRAEQVQAITGIPYYYRQFGYEMALDLDIGRFGYKPHVPRLKEGETELYRIRPAVEADLEFISSLYESTCRRYRVSCVWDEALWRYELNGKSPDNVDRQELG
jgi:predicted acetyltransferase